MNVMWFRAATVHTMSRMNGAAEGGCGCVAQRGARAGGAHIKRSHALMQSFFWQIPES